MIHHFNAVRETLIRFHIVPMLLNQLSSLLGIRVHILQCLTSLPEQVLQPYELS